MFWIASPITALEKFSKVDLLKELAAALSNRLRFDSVAKLLVGVLLERNFHCK